MSLRVDITTNFARNHDYSSKHKVKDMMALQDAPNQILNARILPGKQTPGSSKYENPQSLLYKLGEKIQPDIFKKKDPKTMAKRQDHKA